MNGYNFTERVRRVLMQAREEALLLRHGYVGTEHILLGIGNEGAGVAHDVLAHFGISHEAIRAGVLGSVKQGTGAHVGDLPYTSRAKMVLELSMAETRELGHSYVGTEHLLLGLLREEKGIAAQVLSVLGLTTVGARAEVRRLMGEPGAVPAPVERAVSVTLIVERKAGLLVAKKFDNPADAARFLEQLDP